MIEKYSFKMASGNIYDVMHEKGDDWVLRLLELGKLQKEKSWPAIVEEDFSQKEILEFLPD